MFIIACGIVGTIVVVHSDHS